MAESIVITAYVHENAIANIAVNLFEKPDNPKISDTDDLDLDLDESDKAAHPGSDASNAAAYCDAINGMRFNNDSYLIARVVPENTPFELEKFHVSLNVFLEMDDRCLQKVMRPIDSEVFAKALIGESEAVQDKFFRNCSKRAAGMLKEDMEELGQIPMKEIKEAQEEILKVIRELEQAGEIAVGSLGGIVL